MFRHSLVIVLCGFVLPVLGQASAQERHASDQGEVTVREIATGLEHPWSLAFLPGGEQVLVTERPGRLRLVGLDGSVSEPLAGVPQVFAKNQGGLLDVRLSPDFELDQLVYLSYAEAGNNGKAGTTVGRARLSEDRKQLEDFQVIFRQQPKLSEGVHFGSRLAFDRQGYLFIALGENNQRPTAQDLGKLQGKLVRVFPDGKVPRDNPFVDRSGARPEIWSYGHRNQQGAVLNPWTGVIWTSEHGPYGGDEINIPEAGKNYGWPLATDGINYDGKPIPEARGRTAKGTQPPHYVWEKSPAISGMAFYDGDRFPAWRHNLFIGALLDRSLIRLQLDGDKVVGEERLLKDRGERIRDVRLGADGYLYLLTDEEDGKLLRVGLDKALGSH